MKRLRDFWEKHPTAEQPLRRWYKAACSTPWRDLSEVRETFPHADPVRLKCGVATTVFNIHGNDFRLVSTIDYKYQRVYVKAVMTHKVYDMEHWKVALCKEQKR